MVEPTAVAFIARASDPKFVASPHHIGVTCKYSMLGVVLLSFAVPTVPAYTMYQRLSQIKEMEVKSASMVEASILTGEAETECREKGHDLMSFCPQSGTYEKYSRAAQKGSPTKEAQGWFVSRGVSIKAYC